MLRGWWKLSLQTRCPTKNSEPPNALKILKPIASHWVQQKSITCLCMSVGVCRSLVDANCWGRPWPGEPLLFRVLKDQSWPSWHILAIIPVKLATWGSYPGSCWEDPQG
jgi:hypothetical protein